MSDSLLPQLARATSHKRLKLTIYGSERCNQRCFYCYQDHKGRHLSDETRDGLINHLTARAPDLTVLELGWFGGEPLLAGDNLVAVQTAAHELSQIYGFRLKAGMTTNGTLLSPYLDTLAELGLHGYQITLEGARDLHDVTRTDAHGTPTFDRIWGVLEQMRDSPHPLQATIRLHYRPNLWKSLRNLIAEIERNFLHDHRFNLVFYPLQRWGGHQDSSVPITGSSDYAEIEKCMRSWVSGDVASRVSSPHLPKNCSACDLCYAAEVNAYTISPTGIVGKCTIMQGGKNVIGRLRKDGRLNIDHAAHSVWLQGLVTRDEKALSCPATVL